MASIPNDSTISFDLTTRPLAENEKNTLFELRRTREDCDLVIKANPENILCHKIILKVYCNWREWTFQKELTLTDVASTTVDKIIEYFYVGNIQLTTSELLPALQLIDLLHAYELRSKIVSHIFELIDTEKCPFLREIPEVLIQEYIDEKGQPDREFLCVIADWAKGSWRERNTILERVYDKISTVNEGARGLTSGPPVRKVQYFTRHGVLFAFCDGRVEKKRPVMHLVNLVMDWRRGIYVGIDLDGTTTVYSNFKKLHQEFKKAVGYISNADINIVWFENDHLMTFSVSEMRWVFVGGYYAKISSFLNLGKRPSSSASLVEIFAIGENVVFAREESRPHFHLYADKQRNATKYNDWGVMSDKLFLIPGEGNDKFCYAEINSTRIVRTEITIFDSSNGKPGWQYNTLSTNTTFPFEGNEFHCIQSCSSPTSMLLLVFDEPANYTFYITSFWGTNEPNCVSATYHI